jgi:hypothetical protein
MLGARDEVGAPSVARSVQTNRYLFFSMEGCLLRVRLETC